VICVLTSLVFANLTFQLYDYFEDIPFDVHEDQLDPSIVEGLKKVMATPAWSDVRSGKDFN